MRFRDFGRRSRRLIVVAGSVIVVITLIASLGVIVWMPHSFQSAGKLDKSIFPDLTGRVVDDGGLLSESDKRELTANLKALEDKNTDQVVVVIVRSLRGYSIEEYARSLGNYWGIGTRDKNNGLLLVVAPNEHKVRIEVGRGLETVVTDNIAEEIIDKDILPHFRDGNYAAGISEGVNAILRILAS